MRCDACKYLKGLYRMFENETFDVYSFESIPLDRDCYLMDEIYLGEYEKSLLDIFEGKGYKNVGYVSYVAPRKVHANSAELSWYPNINTRFHEVAISLPKDQFVICVGCWRYDEKPHIFVKSRWLEHLYLRQYSVFGMIDAIGVKEALKNGGLSRDKLLRLRDAIDDLAKRYREVLFISFADSTLLKSNWSVGYFKSDVEYTYEPEIFLRIAKEFQLIYQDALGLDAYAILTQGSNEYYDDSLHHVSETGNHICLNSLGIPFAQLMSIDEAARAAIRQKTHEPSEVYMDKQFYHSLSFRLDFDSHALGSSKYRSKMMSTDSSYYYSTCQHIIDNLN